MALYRAKRDGRGCSRTFDASVDTGVTPDFPVRDPASDRADAAAVPKRRTAPAWAARTIGADKTRSDRGRYLLMREIFEPSSVRLYMRPF